MKLLSDEDKLISGEGPNTNILLTTRRLILERTPRFGGESSSKSFHLEELDSIEKSYESYPWLAIIGGLLLLVSIILFAQNGGSTSGGIFPLIIGGLLILGYFFSRKWGVKFKSSSSTIFIDVEFTGKGIDGFIKDVEKAKKNRLDSYSYKESS